MLGGAIAGRRRLPDRLSVQHVEAHLYDRHHEMQEMLLNPTPSEGVEDPSVVVQRATVRTKIEMMDDLFSFFGGGTAQDQQAAMVVLAQLQLSPRSCKRSPPNSGGQDKVALKPLSPVPQRRNWQAVRQRRQASGASPKRANRACNQRRKPPSACRPRSTPIFVRGACRRVSPVMTSAVHVAFVRVERPWSRRENRAPGDLPSAAGAFDFVARLIAGAAKSAFATTPSPSAQ